MLSERSQTQRPHVVWFYLYEMSRIGKFTGKNSRLEVAMDREKREKDSYCLMSTKFLFGMMKKFQNSGDDCTTLWMQLISLKWILKMVNFMLHIFYYNFFKWEKLKEFLNFMTSPWNYLSCRKCYVNLIERRKIWHQKNVEKIR